MCQGNRPYPIIPRSRANAQKVCEAENCEHGDSVLRKSTQNSPLRVNQLLMVLFR